MRILKENESNFLKWGCFYRSPIIGEKPNIHVQNKNNITNNWCVFDTLKNGKLKCNEHTYICPFTTQVNCKFSETYTQLPTNENIAKFLIWNGCECSFMSYNKWTLFL